MLDPNRPRRHQGTSRRSRPAAVPGVDGERGQLLPRSLGSTPKHSHFPQAVAAANCLAAVGLILCVERTERMSRYDPFGFSEESSHGGHHITNQRRDSGCWIHRQ